MQNGYGTSISHNFDISSGGGGVQVQYQSTATIINCVITNNRATVGGGIYATRESTLHLAGSHIINNNASTGGGLYLKDVDITFDSQNRCNIYNNNGGGADIRIRDLGQVDVIVDTFTVLNPSRFFAEWYGQNYEDPAWYTFDILHPWMELEPNDLFVATDGNDANRGDDPNFPLQTIAWAARKIAADSLHPRTIHVAPGVYSRVANNQVFPIAGKDYISIIGADMDNTILSNDWRTCVVKKSYSPGDFELSNFTIQSEPGIVVGTPVHFNSLNLVKLSNLKIQNNVTTGSGAIHQFGYGENRIEYENLIISNNEAVDGRRAGIGIAPVSGYLKNCVIKDNFLSGPDAPELAMQLMVDGDMLIENCIFTGHHSSENEGRIMRSTRSTSPGSNPHPTITYNNCLIADNSINSNYIFQNFNYTGLTEFNNCTIAGNGGHNSFYNTTISNMGDINVTNTIMYNNDMDYEIFMMADPYYGPWTLNVFHSLIKGGEENIPNLNGVNTINWRDGNLDADADPLFYGEGGDYPFYSLSPNSPCIDAGSNTVNLPECDLAGNRRVYGDGIDMGCYEWQGVSVEDYELPVSHNYQLTNHPNPFTGETIISFNLNTENAENTEVEIYNVKGQLVKQLGITNCELGSNQIIWDASKFASGIYFYKLVVDGKPVDTKKMILLK
jgi:hypothetical protein